jgi:hypothetical protein
MLELLVNLPHTSSPSRVGGVVFTPVASTAASANANLKRVTPVKGKQSKAGKSVRIDLASNRATELCENLCEYAEEIWYSSDHFVGMKMGGKYDAKEWRRQGYGSLLKDTFARATGGESEVQERLVAYCLLDGLEEEEGGESGLARSPKSRRGLERSLSKSHGDERSELKDRVRNSVLFHQQRLKQAGTDPNELTETLAALYRDSCWSARLFARRIGIADALAAELIEGSSTGASAATALRIQEAREVLDRARASTSGARVKISRRNSNTSLASSFSVNSFDSNRRFGSGGERNLAPPRRTLSRTSSIVLSEDLYASIA